MFNGRAVEFSQHPESRWKPSPAKASCGETCRRLKLVQQTAPEKEEEGGGGLVPASEARAGLPGYCLVTAWLLPQEVLGRLGQASSRGLSHNIHE